MKLWKSTAPFVFALSLTACGDEPTTAGQAAGERWQLSTIGSDAVTASDTPWLEFGEDNQLVGFTGCNRLTAAYRRNTDSLYISAVALTRKACPDPVGRDEQRFVAALESALGIVIDGDRLTIEPEAPAERLTFTLGGADR